MSIDWIPSREIKPTEIGNRGIISTQKNPNGYVEYASCIERDFYLLAIHDPNVKAIQHQPISLPYLDKNAKHLTYTPDAYIELRDERKILIEIKPLNEVKKNSRKYETRWKVAKEWTKKNHILFMIVTDEDIRTARWSNIWFTLGASKCIQNGIYIDKLNLIIALEGDTYNLLCTKSAIEFGIEIGKAAQVICYAIYYGLVFVDTFSTKQLSKDTVIRRRMSKECMAFTPFIDDFSKKDDADAYSADTNDDNEEHGLIPDKTITLIDDPEFIERRKEMITAWIRESHTTENPDWKKEFYKKWQISKSQIYRILKNVENEGTKGLQDHRFNSGRKEKYDQQTQELMELARKAYLRPGTTQKQAYNKLLELCEGNSITPPSFSAFKWYVLKSTIPAEKAQKIGKDYSRSRFLPSLASYQGGILPLQVIQIDNTMLDLFPVDEDNREPLSTPYMTAAIDCYSGMIIGFSTSYFPSSVQTILEVVVEGILPKKSLTDEYETQNTWDIQGFPVLILVDNGMDYRASALKDFCKKYDIIIEFVPLRTPRYKAYIEQWFNILKTAIKQEGIPGFRPSLKLRLENPDMKPEKEAVMTLRETETWLHKWIIDEYHISNHYDDHVLAPVLKIHDAINGKTNLIFPAPREPPTEKWDVDTLYLSTLLHEEHNLARNGITWEYLKYNNNELSDLHHTLGDGKVPVLRDRRDVRYIWVESKAEKRYFRVGLGSGWAAALLESHGDKPVHASAWIRNIRAINSDLKERISPYLYKIYISKLSRMELIDSSKKQKKKARKDLEKEKESIRKDIKGKILPIEPPKLSNEQDANEADTQKSAKPKKEIDWSKIDLLPTDDFYSGR